MKYGSKNRKSTKKVIGQLRKTQLITTFGSGSIVDLPGYSVIMAATDWWNGGRKLDEPNLQRLLGMSYFKEPKHTESDLPNGAADIPAFRFPMTHFCPKCNRLMSYRDFGSKDGRKCTNPRCNNVELVPSRFIAGCINGHLEDFPYRWWVHYGKPCEVEPSRYDKLEIEFLSSSGGLSSIVIKCTACGKTRTMEGCMGKDALKGYSCNGKRPWIGRKREDYDAEPCHAQLRTLQRGASNVYFGVTQSALTIPPWSKKIQSAIAEHWEEIKDAIDNAVNDHGLEIIIKYQYKKLIETGQYTVQDFKKEIKRRNGQDQDDDLDEIKLFEQEYMALRAGSNDEEDDQFKAEITEVPDIMEEYFNKVVLIKRLREVLVLKGFRRITPEKPKPNDDSHVGVREDDYTSLSNLSQEWLPAIEMLGEGIFIEFDEHMLRKWEEENSERYEKLRARLGDMNIAKDKFSARYVMLHTFAHLLIRQLTTECGYSGAAIKERIYSTFEGSGLKMAGVLLYTSSSDSDGSLGGLVRQGLPQLLGNTIRNMLQEASWCSSDPICYESESQGYNSLNYAACHACTLLPETSCEARNCLLDRVSIVGKHEDRDLGYFGSILEG